ncbi:MAG: NUDIX hydrolase [bacterium]
MSKAWKKIKSKIIHRNPWYCLREDDVIRPDGKEGKYFYIDGIDSIMVIPEDKDGKIYLVGQTRYTANNFFSWEFILGSFKIGSENAIDRAKKELKEETGMEASEWIELGMGFPINGYSSEKMFFYLAKNLAEGKQKLEPTEDIKIRKENIKTIGNMIKNNEITDMQSIAAFYKYLLYKNNFLC